MPISTLLNSCATEAARRPRLEMRSAWSRRFSRRRRSLSSTTRGRSRLSSGVETKTNPSVAPSGTRSAHAVRNERLSSSPPRRPPDHEPFSRTTAKISEMSWPGMTEARDWPMSVARVPPNNLSAAGLEMTIVPPASVARTACVIALSRASAVNMVVSRDASGTR
jgi:hypothetical protein